MIDKYNLINYLNELFPHAHCSLIYQKDYELLIATMLSAQTTDNAVNRVANILFSKYQSLNALANASYEEIYQIIKSLGLASTKTRNIILIANQLLADGYNYVPNDASYLLTLPGVGNKTKNVVLAELYEAKLLAVDTHVNRIAHRLGLVNKNDDIIITEKKLVKYFLNENLKLINHQLIEFGRAICKGQKPSCSLCKLKDFCKYYLRKT